MERLVDRLAQLLGVLHQPVHLGAGPGDADGIGLLERIGADQEGRHLRRQHDDRDRIQQRVGQPGDGVGGAGARGDQHHAGLAGRAGIALGHVDRALFVADQDVADVVLLEDLVVDRQHRAAGIAEYRVHALIPQRLNHHLRSGHLLSRHLSFLFASDIKKPPGFGGAWTAGQGCRYRPMRQIPLRLQARSLPVSVIQGGRDIRRVGGRVNRQSREDYFVCGPRVVFLLRESKGFAQRSVGYSAAPNAT